MKTLETLKSQLESNKVVGNENSKAYEATVRTNRGLVVFEKRVNFKANKVTYSVFTDAINSVMKEYDYAGFVNRMKAELKKQVA